MTSVPPWLFASGPRRASGLLLLGAGILSLSVVAATCENQDYYEPLRLDLVDAAPFEPAVTEVRQPFRGLNSIDFRVVNTGEEAASYGLFAAAFCGDDGCTEKVASRVVGPLEAGELVTGRFFESELGLGEYLHVEFHCFAEDANSEARCSGTLDFVVLLAQVECRIDNDCAAGEACDPELGLCRAASETDRGCQAAPRRPGPAPALLALAALLAAGMAAGRRRDGLP